MKLNKTNLAAFSSQARSYIRGLGAKTPGSDTGDSAPPPVEDREVARRYVADYGISKEARRKGGHGRKPGHVLEVNGGQFYNGKGYVECPRCHTSFRFDAPPTVMLASDAMADLCPKCHVFVVVNMMNGRVIFEGFERGEDKDERLLELIDQCGPDALVIDRQRRTPR